jgi:hypothetical protein
VVTDLNCFGWFVVLICGLLLYGLCGWWWEADRNGRIASALLIGLLLAALPSWLAEP